MITQSSGYPQTSRLVTQSSTLGTQHFLLTHIILQERHKSAGEENNHHEQHYDEIRQRPPERHAQALRRICMYRHGAEVGLLPFIRRSSVHIHAIVIRPFGKSR